VQDELNAWLAGKRHKPATAIPLAAPVASTLRWTADELDLVRLYLESLPPADFALSDWGLLVDYLVQRYLPVSELQTEAEWFAVRATLMGKVQASLDGKIGVPDADAILSALPLTVHSVQQSFDFGGNAQINQLLEYARLRGCDAVVQITETVRHRLKRFIYAYQEQVLTGDAPPAHALPTQLFDEFGTLNRDWRRIAVTEAGENANQGLIASLAPGAKVQRWERYKGTCPYCKKINGAVLEVVSPSAKKKNGATQVWVGKTNIGRSGAPRKRVGDELIERTAAERWWIPAGTVHPHCRGIWRVLPEAKPTADPKFAAWLSAALNPAAP